MLSISVSSVLDRSRFFLNDVGAQIYTNTVLIEPFKVAYDDLKEECYNNDIAVTGEVSKAIVIAIGKTDIGGPTGPALPIDLVVPVTLWERLQGTVNDYVLMGQYRLLPKIGEWASQDLCYWSWHKQYIHFLGAMTTREVKIDYVADTFTIGDKPEGQINVFSAKSFLSYRTAALAAEYNGENTERATSLNNNAQMALDKFLNINVKNEQSMPVRRRPFMSRYKASRGVV